MQDELKRLVREVYPSGCFEEEAAGTLERSLDEPSLIRLLRDLNGVPGLQVDADMEGSERSVTFYGSLQGYPGWVELNVELNPAERSLALKPHGMIRYLVLSVSRVGRYWTSYWNDINASDVIYRASVVGDDRWDHIVSSIRRVLSNYGLHEIPQQMLGEPILWLSTKWGDELARRGQPPHPTIGNVLFTELY